MPGQDTNDIPGDNSRDHQYGQKNINLPGPDQQGRYEQLAKIMADGSNHADLYNTDDFIKISPHYNHDQGAEHTASETK